MALKIGDKVMIGSFNGLGKSFKEKAEIVSTFTRGGTDFVTAEILDGQRAGEFLTKSQKVAESWQYNNGKLD